MMSDCIDVLFKKAHIEGRVSARLSRSKLSSSQEKKKWLNHL